MRRTLIIMLVFASVSLLSLLSLDIVVSWIRWRLTDFCFEWLVVQTMAWAFALPLLIGIRNYFKFFILAAFTLGGCWVPCYYLLDFYQMSGSLLGEVMGWQFAAVVLVSLSMALNQRLINLNGNAQCAKSHAPVQFKLNQLLVWFACVGMLILVLRELYSPMMVLDDLLFDRTYYFLSIAQAASLLLSAYLILGPKLSWVPIAAINAISLVSWFLVFGFPRDRGVGLWNMVPYERILVIQALGNVVPWAYRWAGWRIVPRDMAERLLEYSNPMAKAPEPRPDVPS